MQKRTLILTTTLLAALAFPAMAQTTPKRVRGTITSLEGNTIVVAATDGEQVKIALPADYSVGAIVPTTMADVKPGTTIGIVGFGPPKQQRAAVISIFPAGAAVNEAQFPWDSQPDSVMTNAPVTADVAGTDGRTLTVTIKGEPIQVAVPANAIIQKTEPGTKAMLVPGAHVLIFAQKAADGTVTAPRINVGKDGFTPAN